MTSRFSRRQSLAAIPAMLTLGACARPPRPDPGPAPGPAYSPAAPITRDEHAARVARAQDLMARNGIGAVLLESGSSLTYFTGIRWGRSERFTGAVLPARGEPVIITPYFEEPSIRDSLRIKAEIRTWHEDADPFAVAGGALDDRGARTGLLGVEETVRHFIVEGVSRAASGLRVVSGNPVVRGCRMIKSPAELALMQAANDITLAAYRDVYVQVEAGMNASDVSALMNRATRAHGGSVEFSMCLLNEASAYPHGVSAPQTVREGSTILMDCGCNLHGYQSDISRTWVFGEPSPKQRKVWATVKAGQELALETAQVGVAAGKVDEAVRAFYEAKGYGPGYLTPGLSHRLGHGIGMDGHEPVNLVRNETTPLAPGMCFSNEPGIYEFGQFSVRLEDCFYMTEAGPKLFTPLSKSIDDPFG